MTTREFYETVATLTDHADLAAFATDALDKMNAANAKRVEKNAEKRAEKSAADTEILTALRAALTSEPQTATTLIAAAELDITPQKAAYLLRADVNAGTVAKSQVAVPEKKGKVTGYARA